MDLKVVKEELLKGREATSQFRRLLGTPYHPTENERGECSNTEAKMACMKNYSTTIVDSFDNSISILEKLAKSRQKEAFSVAQTTNVCPSKSRQRVIETLNLTPDGHTWRKYGQKSILKTKHPREYYRCAYKADQNCQAAKQVQMLSDNPIKYRITYFAHHTCQPLLNNDVLIDINTSDCLEQDITNIISFDLKTPTPFPTQDLNVLVPNSSPLSNNHPVLNLPRDLPHETYHTSLSTMTDHTPPTFFDSTTIVESSQANDMASLNLPDVLFSPRTVMSPNYMAGSDVEAAEDHVVMAFDSFDMSGASLDLPLWD